MTRRTLALAALVALTTASAQAADQSTQDGAPPFAERRFELRALFDRAPGVLAEDANGITAGPFQVDVIVARIDTDGNVVKACVDSEASARRFLEAPVEQIQGRVQKEH